MTSPSFKDSNGHLAQGFKPRHVTMLSIAGIIGAGLFVGSGHAIAAAGPAVLLAYLFSGLLVVLVMRMLGEMAVARPDTGSFSTYADQAIGRWAGFTIGWLYWWFWVLVIPIEALAAGHVLNQWFPSVDAWLFASISIVALAVTNLFSVSKYGEFEFWFAMAKVVAIIGFISLGFAVLMGWIPEREASGLSRLMEEHGGFAPNGLSAVVGAFITIMFSFIGTEAVTIAAAESDNPAQNIAKATRSVIWRIGVFYLLSIFVVISVVPWNDPQLASVGSYQRALELMNIPHAKFLVDAVVLIAVASCMNSSIYIASRML
jgi:AAT family amino acid transporter/GABA permease